MNDNNHNHSNHHNHNNGNNPLPQNLLNHKRKIDELDEKLVLIENGTSKELQMELNQIQQYKHFQLQLLNKFKTNEINECNELYQPQIDAIQSQQKQLIHQFNEYCINELQEKKREIKS